jgi:hypothetical protein
VSRSFAEHTTLNCSTCQSPFSADVWLIVDIGEQIDLLPRILDASLHTVRCPVCGTEQLLDAPLLVHDPANQRLIYVAQRSTDAQQDRQIAQQLGQRLISAIPAAERLEYLTRAQIVTSLDQVSQLLAEDHSVAGDELSIALRALMETTSEAAVWEVLNAHPVLLTEEASYHLQDYTRQLREAGHMDLAAALDVRVRAMRERPDPRRRLLQELLEADSPEQRQQLLTNQPTDILSDLPQILNTLAAQAQRRELEPVARDLLVIRDEVLQIIETHNTPSTTA